MSFYFPIGIIGIATVYTLLIFIVYMFMGVKAWRKFESAPIINKDLSNAPKVSILVPAYNEEVTIIQSIESMLQQDYDKFDIVVINDGSSDNTVSKVIEHYNLKINNKEITDSLNVSLTDKYKDLYTTEIIDIYTSVDKKITLIDKKNGGKSSALNVGSVVSDADWVLCVDADTLLVKNAITNTLQKKRDDVDAVSAMIGATNGQTIEDNTVINPEVPKHLLARIQWLEYLRSFILWRTANDQENSTLVISGAYGLIRRELILEMNGYKHNFLGEDMELTMNIHAHGGKIQFLSEIMAWTEVPEKIVSLGKQRLRWYRGGLQSLIHYRNMAFRKPDNKFLGLFLLPFLWFADVAGPWVELSGWFMLGYEVMVIDSMDWNLYFLLFLLITSFHWISMAIVLTFTYKKLDSNVAMNKWYRFMPIILFETFTYHFFHFYWMLKSHLREYFGASNKWNKFERKGFITE